MDYSLIALIGMIVAALHVSTRWHSRGWPGRPGSEYHRVFSTAAMGLLFGVAGLIGWDLKYSRGWFEGTKWVDGPIWWQVALGAAFLALAAYFAGRVPARPAPR
jgi:hypothetical protein